MGVPGLPREADCARLIRYPARVATGDRGGVSGHHVDLLRRHLTASDRPNRALDSKLFHLIACSHRFHYVLVPKSVPNNTAGSK